MSDDLPRRCREAAETSFSGREVLYAAADRIEALVKERDDALNWGEREHQMAEEYERGREAGIREAAEVAGDVSAIYDYPSVYMGGASNRAKRIAKDVFDAIISLIEKDT